MMSTTHTTGLVDPRGEVGGLASALAQRKDSLSWPVNSENAKVGFLSNGKPNIASLFGQLSEHLCAVGAQTVCSLIKPGPTVPAGTERIEELARTANVIVAGVCDGGTATSWGVNDAIELVARGIPVVLVCTDAFVHLAKSMLPGPVDGLRILSIPHPLSSLTDVEVEQLASATTPRLLAAMNPGSPRDDAAWADAGAAAWSSRDLQSDGVEASNALFARGWTDGLPVFLPRADRVERFIEEAGFDRSVEPEILVPPRHGIATLRAVAANAILAGLPPQLFSYLLAALEASCRPEFNLFGIQTTTNPATPAVVVGGPRRRDHGFNDGLGALGPGSMANATLGRALRLCQQNLGGASATAGTDPSTMGQPGKYIFCFAEDEDANPWTPLRKQVGRDLVADDDDAVTVMAATGTTNLIIKSRNGEEFMTMLAGSIRNVSSNDYMFGGHPLLILCPEHAAILAHDGWSLEAIRQRVFESTKIPFSAFIPKNREMTVAPRTHEFPKLEDDTPIPIVERPEDFLICVAGGPSLHSTYVPSFGGSTPAVAKVRFSR